MFVTNSIRVSDFLKKENNNLDLFRIIAALLVIVGHSYVLFPAVGETDQIRLFTGFTYSGALAVKLFFFISGLVVTNSILKSNSIKHFVISRVFRIFPALLLVLLFSVFVIGPWLSNLSAAQYFNNSATYNYLFDNLRLKTVYERPGVFNTNTYPNAVNGSLWTLPEEVGCYIFLLAVYAIGILKNKWVATVLFLLFIVEMFMPQRFITFWKSDNPEIALLPFSFCAGAVVALQQDVLHFNYKQKLGFILLTYLTWGTRLAEPMFCLTSFSLIVNLSFTELIKKIKIKHDISYGIYLWGFLVQQTVQHFIVGQTVYLKMAISGAVAIIVAYVSWILVEKRFIGYGKNLLIKLQIH